MTFPTSKVCQNFTVAIAYMAYAEAAGYSPTLMKWGRDKWRVSLH